MNMQVLDTRRDAGGGYKVDVSRGQRIGRVSSEWFSRPDDERFLSLGDLARSVRGRSERSRTRVVESALIHVEANRNNPERLALILPGADAPVTPTHWSFGQLASQVGAPAAYLRQLPAPLAAINLQYGLTSHRAEQIKTLETDDPVSGGRLELRAVTGPDYGRIYDHELVEAVQKIAGNGTGDTRWKVPGVLDWSTGIYNPRVDITRDTTTLYASDRDVFLFLVDDLNPIEAGRLPDGSPDLYFRGFYCWNSEVGAKTLGMASFYLRAVCQNRNLWGVEDFEEISIRHSKYAANRFAHEAAPALEGFANSSPQPFINGIKTARERIVARTDEDRSDFLRARGFSKAETGKIIDAVLAEEGRPPESIFDFVQGITALARDKAHQDERLPDEPGALWDVLTALAHNEQMALLAHCVSQGVNALFEPVKGYGGQVSAHSIAQRIAAADSLAAVVGLDMAEAGWTPTVDNYLGRVTKPRIIEAVREAKGDSTAVLIEHLKKGDMAREAERLLEGTGWLPEPLRLPVVETASEEIADLPHFLDGDAEQAEAHDAYAIAAQ